mgnify:CR=1 FL=1
MRIKMPAGIAQTETSVTKEKANGKKLILQKISWAKTDGKYVEIPDRREAIEYSLSHAEDGDIIAIIGKGHEDYQEIEGVRYHFLDREVVQETVKKLHM